ncbi:MAG: hypothetical protein BGO80_17605 [Devosia sp. 63-57]|nr:MAG: hypothetical protein ABS74_12265 [Pelagibacterium sp. SCN 63-126]ODU88899.1 MAG: hypothetical protein ABT14_01140 [Pelagibacterium sp. SCN 63-17]OJX43206.1 MAG: hypothetical protein BGO80_17605 [Devosia sp. 63-57]
MCSSVKGSGMTNRVHIDAPAGVVEIEGEKEFVEGLLAKLFPLLEDAGFGSRPPNGTSVQIDSAPGEAEDGAAEPTLKPKAKRRRVSAPPKGQSCAARILTLRDEGFFKDHRSSTEIVEGLKSKGWTHAPNQVGAALTQMFARGDIQRTKEGNGAWKYFWDRG